MFFIKLVVKVVVFPVMLAMTLIQWVGEFLLGMSAVILNIIAGLILLIAGLSYLMGICEGQEALIIVLTGFLFFLPLMSSLKSLKIQAFLKLIPLKTEPVGDEHRSYLVPNSWMRVWQAKHPACEGHFSSVSYDGEPSVSLGISVPTSFVPPVHTPSASEAPARGLGPMENIPAGYSSCL